MKNFVILISVIMIVSTALHTQETEASRLLQKRNSEFVQEVIKVTDNVYTAVGYSVQPVSMIIGDDGVVIIDTGIDIVSAENVLAAFKKITDKPVKAIILTHGHGDHMTRPLTCIIPR